MKYLWTKDLASLVCIILVLITSVTRSKHLAYQEKALIGFVGWDDINYV